MKTILYRWIVAFKNGNQIDFTAPTLYETIVRAKVRAFDLAWDPEIVSVRNEDTKEFFVDIEVRIDYRQKNDYNEATP